MINLSEIKLPIKVNDIKVENLKGSVHIFIKLFDREMDPKSYLKLIRGLEKDGHPVRHVGKCYEITHWFYQNPDMNKYMTALRLCYETNKLCVYESVHVVIHV
ncbi:hypothetical protein [Sulfolobus ellipsoid virus 1]|uniref:Uncharacterized protein n=1 Tax=Sulfolobus ellipsoid virus 1 TaxID=2056194 RepID=A0A2H4RBM5_9VIRU|nr:hypothetical protein FGG62_gp02 [Sulfolobus ellipsoid virus 1]ATY46480.1 hypothetical protein [Sulfolobus ellipsoid virus 1]